MIFFSIFFDRGRLLSSQIVVPKSFSKLLSFQEFFFGVLRKCPKVSLEVAKRKIQRIQLLFRICYENELNFIAPSAIWMYGNNNNNKNSNSNNAPFLVFFKSPEGEGGNRKKSQRRRKYFPIKETFRADASVSLSLPLSGTCFGHISFLQSLKYKYLRA